MPICWPLFLLLVHMFICFFAFRPTLLPNFGSSIFQRFILDEHWSSIAVTRIYFNITISVQWCFPVILSEHVWEKFSFPRGPLKGFFYQRWSLNFTVTVSDTFEVIGERGRGRYFPDMQKLFLGFFLEGVFVVVYCRHQIIL